MYGRVLHRTSTLVFKGRKEGGGEGLSLAKMTIHSLKLNSRRDHKSIHYSFLSLKKKKKKNTTAFSVFLLLF